VWLHKAEYHEPADLLNLVFGTKYRVKYRRKVFAGAAIQRLRLSFAKVGAAFEAQLGEMEGRGRPGASANPLPAQTFGIGNG